MAIESNNQPVFVCPFGRIEPLSTISESLEKLTATRAYGVVKCDLKDCQLSGVGLRSRVMTDNTPDSSTKIKAVNELTPLANSRIDLCGFQNGSSRIIGQK